jgi:hypothetical protein
MGGHKKGLTPVMKNAMVISHRHDLCPSQKIPPHSDFPEICQTEKGVFRTSRKKAANLLSQKA